MKNANRKTFSVAVFLNRQSKASRDQVAGILHFAASRELWYLHILSRPNTSEELETLLNMLKPDGIIAGSHSLVQMFRRRHRRHIPAVVLDCFNTELGKVDNIVLCADHAIGEAAANFFVSRGFKNFAFAGISGDDTEFESFNSRNRENGFHRALSKSGASLSVYSERLPPKGRHYADTRNLGKWLDSLQKPCALLACSDTIAQSVINVCRKQHIAVPLQIAVLGTDNDEEVCESTVPTISSIAPNYREGGFKAAEILDRLMSKTGEKIASRSTYHHSGIIERLSTSNIAGNRVRVARALEIIRTRALAGLTVRQVAESLNISTRALEIAFKNASRRTIRDEIIETRLTEAKKMILRTKLSSSEIAARCGFNSIHGFKAILKKRTGKSIRRWRSENAAEPRLTAQ